MAMWPEQLGPLAIALITSILGNMLLVWHRQGGAKWMFALGGFLFVLSRLMFVAICTFLFLVVVDSMTDMERLLFGGVFAALILAIGAWSVFAVSRVVWRDAFGAAREGAVRVRYTGRS